MTTTLAAANDTVRALRARAVNVPLPRPLLTAGGAVTSAPLVLIDLETNAGVAGRAYLFCYTALALRATHALLEDLAPLVAGMPLAPRTIAAQLQSRFRLLGPQGLTGHGDGRHRHGRVGRARGRARRTAVRAAGRANRGRSRRTTASG